MGFPKIKKSSSITWRGVPIVWQHFRNNFNCSVEQLFRSFPVINHHFQNTPNLIRRHKKAKAQIFHPATLNLSRTISREKFPTFLSLLPSLFPMITTTIRRDEKGWPRRWWPVQMMWLPTDPKCWWCSGSRKTGAKSATKKQKKQEKWVLHFYSPCVLLSLSRLAIGVKGGRRGVPDRNRSQLTDIVATEERWTLGTRQVAACWA